MMTFRDTNHIRRFLRLFVAVEQLTEEPIGVVALAFKATLVGTRGAMVRELERQFGNHVEDMNPPDCSELHTYLAHMDDDSYVAVRLKFREQAGAWSTIEHDIHCDSLAIA